MDKFGKQAFSTSPLNDDAVTCNPSEGGYMWACKNFVVTL